MRARRKRHKKSVISFKTLVFAFVATLLLFSVGYSLLSQSLSIKGTVNIPGDTLVKNEFRTDNLLLTYDKGNGWHSNGLQFYQYVFTLENVGTVDVTDWEIIFYLPTDYEYVNGWEVVYEPAIGTLSATGNTTNNGTTLKVGQNITFGLQFSSTDTNFDLTKVTIEGITITLGEGSGGTGGNQGGGDQGGGDQGGGDQGGGDQGGGNQGGGSSELLDITYKIGHSWQANGKTNYQVDFSVVNNSDEDLSNFQFDIIVPADTEVVQSWACEYINKNGIITISKQDNGNNFPSHSTINPGMILSTAGELVITIDR